jgi:cytoplasmic iron level regulating protein YaaA (DUF328/UPF0246 family)
VRLFASSCGCPLTALASELRHISDAVKAREKRDNKEYKGAFAEARKSTRRFVGKFWNQENDKAEVDGLQAKVNRFIEEFQVYGLVSVCKVSY